MWMLVEKPKTDPEVLARLTKAAMRVMSAEEAFAQKVSFVWGQLPPSCDWTHDEVEQRLRKHLCGG
ncbi:MAG: hypothetical protein ACOVQ6_04560 [Brevundimonas sp.]|jgi:uncharacterized protein YecE (DUF72 family)|nr:hypothetical protein [Phenylobacterium sp.]